MTTLAVMGTVIGAGLLAYLALFVFARRTAPLDLCGHLAVARVVIGQDDDLGLVLALQFRQVLPLLVEHGHGDGGGELDADLLDGFPGGDRLDPPHHAEDKRFEVLDLAAPLAHGAGLMGDVLEGGADALPRHDQHAGR